MYVCVPSVLTLLTLEITKTIGHLLLDTKSTGTTKNYLVGEDSRIFNHNGQLWLVYNTHLTKYKQLYYVPLQFSASDNSVNVLNEPLHVTYEGEVNVRHQKNWSPFDFCPQCMWDDRGTVDSSRSALQPNHHPANLFFVYSLQPHRIVETYSTNRSDEVDASTVNNGTTSKTFKHTKPLT